MTGEAAIVSKRADISLLRIVATLAVVWGHVGACLINAPDMFCLTHGQRVFFYIVKYSLHWHVPVFFTITGILMLSAQRTLTPRICVNKYVRRFLLALVVFGIPYSFLELFFGARTVSLPMIWKAIVNTINGDSWGHMWYLYTIVGIYLFLPLFKGFTDNASRSELRYVLALLFLYDFCIPLADRVMGTHIGFLSPVLYPVFYLLFGRYLTESVPRPFQSKALCICFLLGYVFIAAVSPEELGLMQYDSPLTAVAVCAVVCLFKGFRPSDRWQEILWRLDRLCFGVYLIHPLFINFVYKYLALTPAGHDLYPAMTIVFFLCFSVLSFAASWAMSLIPPLKKYVL